MLMIDIYMCIYMYVSFGSKQFYAFLFGAVFVFFCEEKIRCEEKKVRKKNKNTGARANKHVNYI